MNPLHIEILHREFKKRQALGSYSLRAFARDIGISPSLTSNVLSNKRGLSELRAREIAKKLRLEKKDTDLFVLSAAAHNSRSPRRRAKAETEFAKALKRKSDDKTISLTDFEKIHQWYGFALLELLERADCQHQAPWFAQKLGISLKQTQDMLEQLTQVGLLEYKDKRYRALTAASNTGPEASSEVVRSYHTQILEQARQALDKDPIDTREFQNTTFAFDRKNLEKAKRMLREFQEDFANALYSESVTKDSVYQLSIQFFRLDQE